VRNVNDLAGLQNVSGLDQNLARMIGSLQSIWSKAGYAKENASSEAAGVMDYLTTIKTASRSMKNALDSLMGITAQSAFKQTAPVSSNSEKLSVDSTGPVSGSFSSMDVHIDQIATQQINKGTALAANANAGGAAFYEFSIINDGNTHHFVIAVEAGDTNQTLQEKMAKAVNDKNIGVTAFVEKDTGNNTATLLFRSKETGAGPKNEFSVQDVYGNAVSITGTANVSQQAKDAIYRIDNAAQKTSSANSIDLGYGIKATLLEASNEAITITAKAGGAGVEQALNDLAKSYNDLVSAAKSSDTPKAMFMNYQLAGVIHTYAPSLSRIGISMHADGTMSVDAEKMTAAAESGELNSMFNRDQYTNYGFADRMFRLASEINANPMKYTDLSAVGLTNYNNDLYAPFPASRYNQVYPTGLFLNMFI
ncbi:MAG: hypothetical protein FWH49_00785, partial [Clostridiales bacterium]|nr:hypothetical protein [Clostridiales bacterium]